MYNAKTIAEYFISYANRHNIEMTPLYLQKHLYFAQAWYLAKYGENLFKEDIEAWTLGPVVPEIYREFKSYGDNQIDADIDMPSFSFEMKAFLKHFIIDKYFRLSIGTLIDMVHNEEAYIVARGNLPKNCSSNEKINLEIVRDSFRKKTDKNKEVLKEKILKAVNNADERYKELYERLA